jgi:hypothetical protein
MEGGYTDTFELICPSCGDHQYLDYSEVSPQLQRLRGSRTLEAALATHEEHPGLRRPSRAGSRVGGDDRASDARSAPLMR